MCIKYILKLNRETEFKHNKIGADDERRTHIFNMLRFFTYFFPSIIIFSLSTTVPSILYNSTEKHERSCYAFQ